MPSASIFLVEKKEHNFQTQWKMSNNPAPFQLLKYQYGVKVDLINQLPARARPPSVNDWGNLNVQHYN